MAKKKAQRSAPSVEEALTTLQSSYTDYESVAKEIIQQLKQNSIDSIGIVACRNIRIYTPNVAIFAMAELLMDIAETDNFNSRAQVFSLMLEVANLFTGIEPVEWLYLHTIKQEGDRYEYNNRMYNSAKNCKNIGVYWKTQVKASVMLKNGEKLNSLLQSFDRVLLSVIEVILSYSPEEFEPYRSAMKKYYEKYRLNCKKMLKEYDDAVKLIID